MLHGQVGKSDKPAAVFLCYGQLDFGRIDGACAVNRDRGFQCATGERDGFTRKFSQQSGDLMDLQRGIRPEERGAQQIRMADEVS